MNDHLDPAGPARSPKRPNIIIGIILIAVGLIIAIGGIVPSILAIVRTASDGESFASPGEHTMRIDEPGEYILWHQTSIVQQGQVRISTSIPSGLQIDVIDEQTGQMVPLTSRTSAKVTIGSTERRSIAGFTVDAPGSYRLRAHGTDEPATLFVGPEIMSTMIGSIAMLSCAALAGIAFIIGGGALILIGALTRPQNTSPA